MKFPDHPLLMGTPPALQSGAPIDKLTKADLGRISAGRKWTSHSIDWLGRIIGDTTGRGYCIPNAICSYFADRFAGAGRTVLEYGCYEGAHSVALSMSGFDVLAIDSRQYNIDNAKARAELYGQRIRWEVRDLEDYLPLQPHDLGFNMGVIYHLTDPVEHLKLAAEACKVAMLVDFNYADPGTDRYVSEDGLEYPCYTNTESGYKAPKSGMRPIARWIGPGVVVDMLDTFFRSVEQVSDRVEQERNGRRVKRATVIATDRR
jgi:tRNA (mo5U34)-methyltransferase